MAGLLKFRSKEAMEKVEAKRLWKIKYYESLKPKVIQLPKPIVHVNRPSRMRYCKERNACRRNIVLLYAKLGLHRYNFLRGKKLQLSSITQFTKTFPSASAYQITLIAEDPETGGSLQAFHSQVNERVHNLFFVACSKYRPPEAPKICKSTVTYKPLGDFMPKLPPENLFQDDTDRFRVLKKSEVLKNEWIRLYLELAVATTNRNDIKEGVSNLKILKVVMEVTPDQEPEGLGAYDVIFYIRYNDSCKDRVGDDVDRVATVRRIVDRESEIFRLAGHTQSYVQTITPSKGNATINEVGSSSAQD